MVIYPPPHILVVHFERSVGVLFTQLDDGYRITHQFPVGLSSPVNRTDETSFTDFSFNIATSIETAHRAKYGDLLIPLNDINGRDQPEELHQGDLRLPEDTVQIENNSTGCITFDRETLPMLRDTMRRGDHIIVLPNEQTDIAAFFGVDSTKLSTPIDIILRQELIIAEKPVVSSKEYYSTHTFP